MRLPLPRRVVTAALVGPLLLAGCRGEDPAPPPPVASETPAEEPEPEPEAEPEPEPEPTARAPLSGTLLTDEGAAVLAERPVLITKVENSPQARPQAGLDHADVVLEELVEGGVTRFIAILHSDLPDDVGPVRSGRPVDVAIGSGFGESVFVYSGARAQVQGMLRASPMVLLEEGAPGVRRVSDRRPPHNVFIRPAEVLAAGIERGAGPFSVAPWAFADEAPDGALACAADSTGCTDPGASITVPMSRSNRTGWTYDAAAELYRRDQNGQASTVTGSGRIGAANVVVLATRHYTDGCCDTNGAPYSETDVIGEDVAIILRDGQRFDARWRKTAADQPLELLGPGGEPFQLKPGPTWIHLPSSEVVAGM
ncbi:MAG: DUF3048 domain-containing protein [Nitriliruptor sp.]|uniref:DUF3048 domain-containing protein n=1 Tax=Nitriliruptor sp. TaxID=2448056 RepID=UPI0034A0467A